MSQIRRRQRQRDAKLMREQWRRKSHRGGDEVRMTERMMKKAEYEGDIGGGGRERCSFGVNEGSG
jgi:hypothetical protein